MLLPCGMSCNVHGYVFICNILLVMMIDDDDDDDVDGNDSDVSR